MRDELFQILMDISIKTGVKLDYLVFITEKSLDNKEHQDSERSLIKSEGKSPRRAKNKKSKVVP